MEGVFGLDLIKFRRIAARQSKKPPFDGVAVFIFVIVGIPVLVLGSVSY